MADDPIIAELADGRELEFPAGTSPDIVKSTVRKMMGKGTSTPSSSPTGIEGVADFEGNAAEALQTITSIASGLSPHVPAISGAAGALRVLGGIPRGESFNQALTAGQKTMEQFAGAITVPLPDTKTARELQEYAHLPFKTINKAAEKLGDLSMWISPNSPNLAAIIASAGEFAAYSLIFNAMRSKPKMKMAEAETLVEKMAAEEIAKREGQPRALPPGPSAVKPKALTEGPLYAEAEGGRAPKPAGAFPLPPETRGALPERAGGPFEMPSIEASYATQAQDLGITFNGMQDVGIQGRPPVPTFTDPVTGSTFMRTGRESVAGALSRKRTLFEKDQTPGAPPDIIGAQYEATLGDLMLEKVYERAQAEEGARLVNEATATVRYANVPDTAFGDVVPGTPTKPPSRAVDPTPTGAVSSIVRAYRDSVEAGQMNPRVAAAEMIRRGQEAGRQGNEYASNMFYREAREIYFHKNNRAFLLDEIGSAQAINDLSAFLKKQWESTEFKKWFGASTVSMEDGRPRVVYHGTSARDFAEFDTNRSELGAHFGTAEQAAARVHGHYGALNSVVSAISPNLKSLGSTRVYPAYLALQHPLRLQDFGAFDGTRVAKQLHDLKIISRAEFEGILELPGEKAMQAEIKRIITNEGYDGIVYLNRHENVAGTPGYNDAIMEPNMMTDAEVMKAFPTAQDSYIAFEPAQVKSPFNKGTFDPRIADISGSSMLPVDMAKWLLTRGEKLKDGMKSGRIGFLDFFTPGNLASEYWRDFVGAKGSEKAGRMLDSKYFWEDSFKKAMPDGLARQAMTLFIQTGGDAKAAREYLPRIAEHDPALSKGVAQVIDRMEKMTPQERNMADIVKGHMDEMFKAGVDESVLATYYKDYVTQLWKERATQPKRGTALRSRMLNPRFQFSKERFYTNYLEGMAEGLKPYSLDIADIGRVYDAALSRTIFHKQVIDKLQETGQMKYANTGEIPEGWVSTERLVPASRQHMVDLIREEMFKRTGKALDSNALKDILPQFTHAKVYVSPEAYPMLKQFFGRGLSGQDIIIFSNLKKAAIATKQMILSLSGFHYKNLFTTAFDQIRHGKDPVTVLTDGLKLRADPVKAKWWVEHDLRIGPADAGDAYMNMSRATIGEPAKAASGWAKMKDRVYKAYQGNQHFLWEKFVPALKIADAEMELASRIKEATSKGQILTEEQTAKMARGISEVVNRKYGILNWEKMGTTPMAKDVLQTMLLAPDWTLSNMMYLRSAFKEGIEGSKARRDIGTSLLVWQTSLNALNYAFSAYNEQRKDETYFGAIGRGAGHAAWSNPPGKRLYLELPGRSREGRRFYGEVLSPGNLKDITRFVMGFGDVTEWQRFASGKLHTFPKTSMEIMMNKDWAGEDIMDRNETPWRQAFSLIGHVARAPMPIPLQAVTEYATGRKEGVQAATSGLGLGAVTKGPSATVVIGWIKHGLRTGDMKMIERAMATAADEGIPLDIERLMRQEAFRKFMNENRASQTPIPALNKLLRK